MLLGSSQLTTNSCLIFVFLGNVNCVLKLSICRKVKILESLGKWMRFYLWKDILDINICCYLRRSVWKSFVKLKVKLLLSIVSENMVTEPEFSDCQVFLLVEFVNPLLLYI